MHLHFYFKNKFQVNNNASTSLDDEYALVHYSGITLPLGMSKISRLNCNNTMLHVIT